MELFSGWYPHRQEGGEAYRLVHGRCHAWLCDSARRHAWESIFLLLFEGFGDIFWFFPSGAQRVSAGLVSSTFRYNLQKSCLKVDEGRKGHLRHRVSSQRQDSRMLTFLRTVVCYTSMEQTWKPWQLDVACHPIVLTVKGKNSGEKLCSSADALCRI